MKEFIYLLFSSSHLVIAIILSKNDRKVNNNFEIQKHVKFEHPVLEIVPQIEQVLPRFNSFSRPVIFRVIFSAPP